MPGTIRSVLRGERPVIRSDGQFVRDYFYVEDGAAAYMLLAEQLHCRPDCAGRRSTSPTRSRSPCSTWSKRILQRDGLATSSPMCERGVERNPPPVPERRRAPAPMLGWAPLFTLDEGLERTIAWYREFLRMMTRKQRPPRPDPRPGRRVSRARPSAPRAFVPGRVAGAGLRQGVRRRGDAARWSTRRSTSG